MSTIDTIPLPANGSSLGAVARNLLSIVWSAYRAHRQLRRTRFELLELTDDQLKDIGISRDSAEREALRSTLNRYLHGIR